MDNVVDLGVKVSYLKAEVPSEEQVCLRAFTRAQAKALTGSETTGTEHGHTQSTSNITSETMLLPRIDVMGLLPLSKEKNKYILVIVYYFTRRMEAYPLPSQEAEPVAQKVVMEFFSRLGTSLEVHSDQGRNFESQLFKEVLKLSKTGSCAAE